MSLRYIDFQSLHYRISYQGPWVWLVLEKIYAAMVWVHQWAYNVGLFKVYHLPVPVISVGNLTTGGTGKTPITLSLAQYLESQGKRVAILSRGYGASVKTRFHEANSAQYGDEPALMQQHLKGGKVFVGRNRVYTGQKAIDTFQPDVILLDDGFQHRRLYRDMDIVLIDGERGFGNGHLLPAGPLREPVSQLQRADWVLVTKANHIPDFLAPLADSRFLTCPFAVKDLRCPNHEGECLPLSHLAERTVILLSGIAQNDAFKKTVQSLPGDFEIQSHLEFNDHQVYQYNALEGLFNTLSCDISLILVTTEKDWVKLAEIMPIPLWQQVIVVRLQPEINWAPLLTSFFTLPAAVS